MQRLRPLLAGIALVVLACLGTAAVAAARPEPPPRGPTGTWPWPPGRSPTVSG